MAGSSLRLRWSYRQIALFSLPLAVSGIAMTGESPVVNAGISRLNEPEIGLAGFGVAMSVAWLIESPIGMMLDASTARATDRESFSIIRRFALVWCAFLTAVAALVAFTPLGMLVFRDALGVSRSVATAAQDGMAFFIPWPLAIAWRRMHQGLLMRHGLTRVIGYAVATRLVVVSLVVAGGVWLLSPSGVRLGVVALIAGVWFEATIVWVVGRRVMRRDLPDSPPPGTRPVTSMREFHRYYLPLAGTMVCFFMTSPIIAAGLARASEPTLSLAAWPVAYSFMMFAASPMNAMQQVAIYWGQRPESARMTRRFLIAVGLSLTAMMVVSHVSGGTRWLLGTAIGAPTDVLGPATTLAWLLVPLPILYAARSLWRGLLIAGNRTGAVQTAILLNVVTLALMAIGLAPRLGVDGYVVGGLALILATTVETAWLRRCVVASDAVETEAGVAAPPA